MYSENQLITLKDITLPQGGFIPEGTVLNLKIGIDTYFKDLNIYVYLHKNSPEEAPQILHLHPSQVKRHGQVHTPLETQDFLRLFDHKSVQEDLKAEVDHLSEVMAKILREYLENENPAINTANKIPCSKEVKLLLIGRVLNSLLMRHQNNVSHFYVTTALDRVQKAKTETDTWIGEVIKEIKQLPEGKFDLILERLNQLAAQK